MLIIIIPNYELSKVFIYIRYLKVWFSIIEEKDFLPLLNVFECAPMYRAGLFLPLHAASLNWARKIAHPIL